MTNEEIKLLKNFITWQSLPFVDNLFTHEDEIIKKFDKWLKLNVDSNDRMTNEEAKNELFNLIEDGVVNKSNIALKMGIKALEQQPCKDMRDATEEERKSTKDYIDSISKPTGLRFDDLYEEIDFVQPHKKIPCTITIGNPCEDCISRKAVLDYIDKMPSELASDGRRMIRRISLEEYISDTLPSVAPKMGHWINADDEYPFNAICSSCNRLNRLYGNYCKHCGAKMVEPQKSEDEE